MHEGCQGAATWSSALQTDELLATSADVIRQSHRLLGELRRELIATNEHIEQTRKSVSTSRRLIQLFDENLIPYYPARSK